MATNYVKDKNDPRIPVLKEDLKAAAELANQMGLTPIYSILCALRGTMMIGPDSIMGLADVAVEYAKKERDKLEKIMEERLKGK